MEEEEFGVRGPPQACAAMLAAMTGTKQRGHTTYGESAESAAKQREALLNLRRRP